MSPRASSGHPLERKALRDAAYRILVGDRLGSTFDDQIERWKRCATCPDDAPTVGREVARFARPVACDKVKGAIDPEGDHWHEMWLSVGPHARQPIGALILGIGEALAGGVSGGRFGLSTNE